MTVSDDRPLWFLGPGSMPFPASPKGKNKGKPGPSSGVTHWCREGDKAWEPIATFLARTTPKEEVSR